METILHIYSVHENELNRFSYYSRDVYTENAKAPYFKKKIFSTNFFALVPQAEKGIPSFKKFPLVPSNIPWGSYKNLNLIFPRGTSIQSFSSLALLFRKLWC